MGKALTAVALARRRLWDGVAGRDPGLIHEYRWAA
jgi:hypothetical protein